MGTETLTDAWHSVCLCLRIVADQTLRASLTVGGDWNISGESFAPCNPLKFQALQLLFLELKYACSAFLRNLPVRRADPDRHPL